MIKERAVDAKFQFGLFGGHLYQLGRIPSCVFRCKSNCSEVMVQLSGIYVGPSQSLEFNRSETHFDWYVPTDACSIQCCVDGWALDLMAGLLGKTCGD